MLLNKIPAQAVRQDRRDDRRGEKDDDQNHGDHVVDDHIADDHIGDDHVGEKDSYSGSSTR